MADNDSQTAMDLSRSVNPVSQRRSLLRAAKKSRTLNGFIPMAPQSGPSTSPQSISTTGPVAVSSPLSSAPLSENFFNGNGQSGTDLALTPPSTVPINNTKARGKKRSAEEADDEFSPIHDPEEDPDTMDVLEESIKKTKSTTKRRVPRKGAARKPATANYHVNNQLDKPEPYGQPEVWADKRQQLCETLPYYVAYQSGAYTTSGIVMGQLIDMEVDRRDKFDEQIIITSVQVRLDANIDTKLIRYSGGGKSKDESGKSVRAKDFIKNHAVAAFMRTKEEKLSVGVIAGQGNSKCPSRLPHKYNVLDWFHITDVWAEKCEGMTAWKVRLEKVFLAKKSWWAAKSSSVLTEGSNDHDQKAQSQTCPQCSKVTKTIYNAGWTCLATECTAFFQFENDYDDASLEYSEEFLKERTSYQGLAPPPLSPPLLTDRDMAEMDAFGVEKAFKRGIVCPQCGCCSRRIAWDYWSCENLNCDYIHRLQQKPLPIDEVIARYQERSLSRSSLKKTEVRGGIQSSLSIHGPWDICEYKIPGEKGEIIGFVRHFKSNTMINEQQDGPNDIFLQMQMQTGELNLRRNPARLAGSTAEVLTSHWAANWGAPYKFGVKQISKGFGEAPPVVLKAIKRLTWAGQVAVTDEFEPFQPFNECLSIGYFEGSKISYHDDGEKELGPTVATLSLGASASMTFRPKVKSAIGKANTRAAQPTKPIVLRILLEHGDIMVMHGRKIQQLYEHAVEPMGALRFALTCRYIRPELMANEAETRDAISSGTLPPSAEEYNYDGDMKVGDMNAAPKLQCASVVNEVVNCITAKLKTGELTASQVHEINQRLAAVINSSNTKPDEALEGHIETSGAA